MPRARPRGGGSRSRCRASVASRADKERDAARAAQTAAEKERDAAVACARAAREEAAELENGRGGGKEPPAKEPPGKEPPPNAPVTNPAP